MIFIKEQEKEAQPAAVYFDQRLGAAHAQCRFISYGLKIKARWMLLDTH